MTYLPQRELKEGKEERRGAGRRDERMDQIGREERRVGDAAETGRDGRRWAGRGA